MDVDDAAIVKRVVTGDQEAFALLVERHHARCLRIAVHLLGDADEAEDAVQDAFVRAYRALGSYREQDRFGAWLTRIVVNRCRTARARSARLTSLDDIDPAGSVDAADRAEQRVELARALAQLGAAQREAIVLRYADQLSYDEMSTVTGVGVSALKMRVQRASARLRTLLSEYLHA